MRNKFVPLTVVCLAIALTRGSVALAQADSFDACFSATESGQYGQAVDECTDAIESGDLGDSDLATAYYNRGLALKNLEKYQDAVDDYSEAIELDPDWFEAWVNRGNAYTWLGEYERGIEDYDYALQLHPGDYITLENRGQAYANLRQHERAIEDYDESLRQNPSYEVAYMDRGASYEALGDLDRALQDQNKAIELSPDYIFAYGNRSNVLRKLRRYEEALRDIEQIRQLDPDDVRRFYGLGQTYFEMGEFDNAMAAFDRASESAPADPYMAIWHFLAVARNENDLAAAQSQSRDLSQYLDGGAWPSPILRFFLGEIDAEAVLSAAADNDQSCEALFYVGMIDLLENKLESGRSRLEIAARDCPTDFVEPYAARAELERLKVQ